MRNSTSIGFAICLIVVLNCIAFFPTLTGNFLNWDDEENVVYKEDIRAFGPDHLTWIFTDFTVGDFKPLAWTSYCFDYTFWRLNPFGYHLGNLLLHIVSGVLVLVLFSRLGIQFSPSTKSIIIGPAFLAALFFSLHPLRAESIGWISERKDVLCCVFYLASIVAYLRYIELRRPGWYQTALLFALLAMLSKPMAVTITLVLILIDFLVRGERNPPAISNKRWLREKIPFFLLAVGVGILAFYGQTRHQALVPLRLIGPAERVRLFCNTLVFYLGKIILPVRLSAAYPATVIFSRTAGSGLPAGMVLASFTIFGAGLRYRRYRGPLFFWLWFVIAILPVSGIFPTGMASAADRFTYLPSIGIAGLLFTGLCSLSGRRHERKVFFAALTGSICLMILSYRQAGVWVNSEVLWRDAVESYPDAPIARAHLGQLLYQRGEDRGAVIQLRRALKVMEGDPMARGDIIFAVRGNLARALGRLGDPAAGAAILEDILESRDDWITHHSLAGMYAKLERKDEAIAEYERVISARPAFVPALCEYGLLLAQSGMPDRAIAVYSRALTVLPDSPRTRYNLSLALLDRGEPARAAGLLEQLAVEYPDRARVAEALIIAYRIAGMETDGAQFQEELNRKPPSIQSQLPYSKGERPDVLIPIR